MLVIHNTICSRCESKFFTAYLEPGLSCPFCGYEIDANQDLKVRRHRRAVINRPCEIVYKKDLLSVYAQDISKSGVCIRADEHIRIEVDDTLKLTIKGFELNADAKVIWTDRKTEPFKAGLKFC